MNSMTSTFNRFLEVPLLDPDDARRRRLLNIVLFGLELIALVTLIIVTIQLVFAPNASDEDATSFLIALGVLLGGILVIYLINRYLSGIVAATLFLMLLTAILAAADTPQEVVAGRTLFLFTVPIIMASVLLSPVSSFFVAIVVGVMITVIGLNIDVDFNPAVMGGFISVAFVSWLSARSLEQALRNLHKTNEELETINRELDKRVVERTQALREALDQVIRESNQTQAILESLADGVIVFDNEGAAFVANKAVEQLIGLSSDKVMTKTLAELMKGSVKEDEQKLLTDQIAAKDTSDENITISWGAKTLSMTFATVRDGSGKASGKVVVFRDYTSEAELDKMKSGFLSMASHELRTPLNAILGYSDMMKEGVLGAVTETQVTTLQRVIANVHRMLNLVNNLLDQAQIDAGKLALTFKPFDVKELVEEIHSFMNVLAVQKELSLTYEIADDLPKPLVSDAQRLHQVLANLVGNAIKYTNEGSIKIHVGLVSKDRWKIDVIDTGVGIAKEKQVEIFEAFEQVDDPLTRQQQGSGLGLSIVKQLTRLLEGEIELKSEVSKGSTFSISLPVKPKATEGAAS